MTARAPAAQLDALTGIRGIAAWAVVLYHTRVTLTGILPPGAIGVLAKGYLAVDLFFMLSGFVIWLNYADRLHGGGSPAGRWRAALAFWWRRFARIWPLHIAVLTGFLLLEIALEATGRHMNGVPMDHLPLQILLIQNWGFTSELSWNHPAWSISTEAGAYLTFPLLVALLGGRRLAAGMLLALMTAVLLGVWALFAAHGYRLLGDDICGLGLWRCLLEFSAGALACQLWRATGGHTAAAWPFWLAGLAWLALGAAAGLPETALVPGTLLCAVIALTRDTGPVARALSARAAVWLGDLSYATYLAHSLIFIVFKLAFVGADKQVGWVGLAAYLGIVLAASWVLYTRLEKPAQAWLNESAPDWADGRRSLATA